jgi:hypothetical protein
MKMAKLKNVDAQELKAANDAAGDLIQTLHDLTNRIEKMYVDAIDNPLMHARTFNSLCRASAEMVTMLLSKHAMQEQRREIDRITAERDAIEKK